MAAQNASVAALSSQVSEISSAKSAQGSEISKLAIRIESYIADLETRISKLHHSVSITCDTLAKKVDEIIGKAKEELSSAPSIEAIKSEVMKKLETVSIDSANASLKASNSAQQIYLLEKKLENLALLLKKHELSA
jgi:vacuolar-type H+-ATPase subunit I/STV1